MTGEGEGMPMSTTARRRTVVRPQVVSDGPESGTLVLRDGSRMRLARALPEDALQVRAFLDRLEEVERADVVASLRLDEAEMSAFLERLADQEQGEALVVHGAGEEQVVGFAAFRRFEGLRDAANVAIAVAPSVRRMGVGTLLLERLTVVGARRGVGRLVGRVQGEDDRPALRLFRSAGFEADVRQEGGLISFLISTRPTAEDPAIRRGIRGRTFTAASLRPLFEPASVAVVGASRNPSSLGYRLLSNLVQGGFNGPVYPVNPHASHVLSIRAYPSLEAVGEPVDLAVVVVPAAAVPEVVESCAVVGVKAVVVVSAGYAEVGGEGAERQRLLLEQVRAHGLRMVGPNCMGILHLDTEVRLNASLAGLVPDRGAVALGSHSGALGVAILALARRIGLGLSSFVSLGNRADVSGNDLLEFWESDPSTRVILFYLESFGSPRRFARIARRVGRSKPIMTVKAGWVAPTSVAGRSHAASLVTPAAAVEALLAQTGVIRADTLEEMFGIARLLAEQPLPRGRRVAVLTNASAPATLCVDALTSAGLELTPLRPASRAVMPPTALEGNPVDIGTGATADSYRQAVEALLAAEEVDALVVLHVPVGVASPEDVGRGVAAGVDSARVAGTGVGKPVVASIVGDEAVNFALHAPGGEKIPLYAFPEAIGRYLGKVTAYAEWRSSDPGVFPEFDDQRLADARDLCRRRLSEHEAGWMPVDEVRAVLEAAGLEMADSGGAASAEAAVRVANRVGYPVVVKLASPEIVNRAELGGVALGLEGPGAVRAAFAAMRARLEADGRGAVMTGVLVQPMLSGAAEVMMGVREDETFGPVVGFGLGGVHVETLGDVAFRVSPLTDLDARAMVREIRGFPLLEGYRGHPRADLEALEEALLRLSRLVEAVPEVAELDLNPVFALAPGSGYRIVGARIRVAEPGR
jgi:acetate---CoA ligase (ADP-forming)